MVAPSYRDLPPAAGLLLRDQAHLGDAPVDQSNGPALEVEKFAVFHPDFARGRPQFRENGSPLVARHHGPGVPRGKQGANGSKPARDERTAPDETRPFHAITLRLFA